MKAVYWRPQRISRPALVTMAGVCLAGLMAVETLPRADRGPYSLKLAAAELADQSMLAIRDERLRRGHTFSGLFDPAQSGMLGVAMSPVTSIPADLHAKQTSVNPNLAAHIVDMLSDCGLQPGDRVAVGLTGSYPALNVCLYAAMNSLDLRPIIIASAASSQFGANLPDMMWPDMERLLHEKELIPFRAKCCSLGGYGDRAAGMEPEAQQLLVDAIERNGLSVFRSARLAESVNQRMRLYADYADGEPIAAYVNVGGGSASIRGKVGKAVYRPGVHKELISDPNTADCVLTRFLAQGIPVIHLSEAKKLAEQCGLPIAPTVRPVVGDDGALVRARYNRPFAAFVLLALALGLTMLVRPDLFVHWAAKFRRCRSISEPRPSVNSAEPNGLRLMV